MNDPTHKGSFLKPDQGRCIDGYLRPEVRGVETHFGVPHEGLFAHEVGADGTTLHVAGRVEHQAVVRSG